MHNIESMLLEKNYSKCPLKKRPINYDFDEDVAIVIDNKECLAAGKQEPMLSDAAIIGEEPENLSLKKESTSTTTVCDGDDDDELIVVSDCCEDEGVDVGRLDDDSMCEDDSIDCIDIEDSHSIDANTTEAAALAAAVAAASAAASVVVPTPTYPKYTMPSWNFHMSPYTAEFYRTINNPHLCTQISPLRGELLSPSSPSDSVGSLSPPPHHYLPGRASSVSPPMRTEIIHRPIGVRQIPPSPQHGHHRFLPYPLAAYNPSHGHTPSRYPLGYINHHPPISPAYSETSYYSMRSLTPESIASPVPEDLSIKHPCNSVKPLQPLSENIKIEITTKVNATAAAAAAASATTAASAVNNTTTNTKVANKKDKAIPLRYQCLDCQKSYSTFSGLTKHQQFHCPAAEGNQIKKSFSCKDCDKTYVSLGALKMHIRTHTLPCKCNICGKAFSRPWLLQGHIRTHTGEKPFSCQHCHRAFADRSNLRAHLQTHSDIKKYSCSSCSKTFSRMSLLTKHSEGGCQGSTISTVNTTSINNSNPVSVELAAYPLYNHHLDH